LARNSRVGGVNSWRRAADDSVAYRPKSSRKSKRGSVQTNDVVPEFADEDSRYGWEMEQWRNAALTRRKWRKWFGSDGNWHVGPPIYPGSDVFTDPVAQKAFKAANKEGYMAPRMVGEAIGIGRYEAKRLLDAVAGEMRVAWVIYPHTILKGTIWNCRMLHEDDVPRLEENITHWRAVFERKIKSRELPPPSNRMSKYMGQVCQKQPK
jgi:hypothetical protein